MLQERKNKFPLRFCSKWWIENFSVSEKAVEVFKINCFENSKLLKTITIQVVKNETTDLLGKTKISLCFFQLKLLWNYSIKFHPSR